MAKIITPLTDTKCNSAKPKNKDYKLFDGGGLFLLVKKNSVKSWRMKYKKPDGKESTIVFGDYPTVSLKDAREQREKNKQLLTKKLDPVQEKQKTKLINNSQDTFKYIANDWIEQTAKSKSWKLIHKSKIIKSFEKYIFPKIGNKPVQIITTRELITLIQEIIDKGVLDVASRLKQQTVSIMRHALYKGLIEINPAIDLTGLTIASKTKHRATITLEELPELITKITNYTGTSVTKLLLLLNLHIFIRASELTYARWAEIDLANKLWTIPAAREPIAGISYSERGAKMMTAHLIPLSNQAIEILKQIKQITEDNEFVFTCNGKKPIHYGTPTLAIRTLGYKNNELSFHGFRTLACSALIESGQFSKDAIERQMSHQERNGVRAAYIHKAEHLDERIRMMQWWSDYLDHVKENGYIAPYQFKNNN